MCKIILKYKEALTSKEMESHRERNEDGAGFSVYRNDALETFKEFEHAKAFKAYDKIAKESPFVLFHSRLPSAGAINRVNIQPVQSEKNVFCHNGTQSHKDLMMACLVAKVRFLASDSDSVLLFKLLDQAPLDSAIAMLISMGGNFVFVSKETMKIYLIGTFKHNTKAGQMKLAWNAYATDKVFIETDFKGVVTDFFILDPKGTAYAEREKQEKLEKFMGKNRPFNTLVYEEGEIVGYMDKNNKFVEYKEGKKEISTVTHYGSWDKDKYPGHPNSTGGYGDYGDSEYSYKDRPAVQIECC